MPLAPVILAFVAPVMWLTIVNAAWGLPTEALVNHLGRGVEP